MSRASILLGLLLLCSACAPSPEPVEPAPQEPRTGSVHLTTSPFLWVWLDGKFAGVADDKGLAKFAADSGPHRLRVSGAGLTPRTVDITVSAGSTLEIQFPPLIPAAHIRQAAMGAWPRRSAGAGALLVWTNPASCVIESSDLGDGPWNKSRDLWIAEGVPPGAYNLRVSSGDVSMEYLAQVAPDETHAVTLDLAGNRVHAGEIPVASPPLQEFPAGTASPAGAGTSPKPPPGSVWPVMSVLHHPATSVYALAWSPQGTWLATGARDGRVRLWDPLTGVSRKGFGVDTREVRALAFSPDGRRLLVGDSGGRARVRDLDRDVFEAGPARFAGAVLCVALSPDGNRAACGTASGELLIWDTATGATQWEIPTGMSFVADLAFTRRGKALIACGAGDPAVVEWSLETGEELVAYRHSAGFDRAMAVSSLTGRVASGDADGEVNFWILGQRLEANPRLWTRGMHTRMAYPVRGLALDPAGRRLAAAGSWTQEVVLYDFATNSKSTLAGHTDIVTCVAFSPGGSRLASGGLDSTVRVWKVAE